MEKEIERVVDDFTPKDLFNDVCKRLFPKWNDSDKAYARRIILGFVEKILKKKDSDIKDTPCD
jgi:hypothetical protein